MSCSRVVRFIGWILLALSCLLLVLQVIMCFMLWFVRLSRSSKIVLSLVLIFCVQNNVLSFYSCQRSWRLHGASNTLYDSGVFPSLLRPQQRILSRHLPAYLRPQPITADRGFRLAVDRDSFWTTPGIYMVLVYRSGIHIVTL